MSEGGEPSIARSREPFWETSGIDSRSPHVYGWSGWSKSSSFGASSDARPAYMTITVWATSAITDRSCVIRITPMLNSFLIRAISSRICACTVTSSAVVGSSAIRMSGLWSSAIAIMARCRIPPEYWCG